jgi:hypothetical protein
MAGLACFHLLLVVLWILAVAPNKGVAESVDVTPDKSYMLVALSQYLLVLL